jgi:Protein kinase domain/WD40-like Beta Propeller Repeat
MSLAPGTRIGPYEIVSMVGAGGMGEVYRAHDARLGRDVALKILPTVFASDPERIARFDREARTLASLNHPHIGAIYGFEETNGLPALALEFVEGETLADRLSRGPIPLDEALPIARQIAEALEAAHEHGIIHRDLKPANIKLREDGTVKVLDFGLAKALEPLSSSAGDMAAAPTITSPAMTQMGVILGTAAYMSPEQACGKPVDKRADIWAFGNVLFEMLTGRRLFAGENLMETIALVVKGQPDLSAVSPTIQRLLRKCLERDPKRRLRDIGDVWELLEPPSGEAASQTIAARQARALWVAASVVLAGGVLWLLASGVILRRESVPIRTNRFPLTLPEGRAMPPLGPGGGTSIALSPDGGTLAYIARESGEWRLFRKFAHELEAVPIGDLDARAPFFSPDGQWVGFRTGAMLKRVSVHGGPAQTIAQVGHRGSSWNTDGTIILGGGSRGLLRVSEKGGNVDTLATTAPGRQIWYPQLLPGGRAVLYTESADEPDVGELRR